MGLFVQAYTLYGHLRPFGVSSVFGGYDENGPALFMIDPSGLTLGYYGVALGKGQLPAKTELERLKLPSITCRYTTSKATDMLTMIENFTSFIFQGNQLDIPFVYFFLFFP
jgi:20S proteasome subunit alpha 7